MIEHKHRTWKLFYFLKVYVSYPFMLTSSFPGPSWYGPARWTATTCQAGTDPPYKCLLVDCPDAPPPTPPSSGCHWVGSLHGVQYAGVILAFPPHHGFSHCRLLWWKPCWRQRLLLFRHWKVRLWCGMPHYRWKSLDLFLPLDTFFLDPLFSTTLWCSNSQVVQGSSPVPSCSFTHFGWRV